jgi:hypothetical protein
MGISRQQHESQAPLWSWFIAMLTAPLLMFATFVWVSGVEVRYDQFDRFNLDRLEALLANDTDLKLLFLGDSRTRYAIEPSALEKAIHDQIGRDTSVLLITANRANWHRFSAIAERLREQPRPEIILMDSGLFAKEWRPLHKLKLKRDFLVWSNVEFGTWLAEYGGMTQDELQTHTECIVPPESPEVRASRVEDNLGIMRFDPNGEAAQMAMAFVDAMRQTDTKVMSYNVPAAPGGEPLSFQRALDDLSLRVDFAVEDEKYCDAVHLNETGRNEYTASIAVALSERIRDID